MLLYVGADWCPPCRIIDPVIKELSATYRSTRVVKLPDDKHIADDVLQGHAEIPSVPFYLLLKDGKIVDQFSNEELSEESKGSVGSGLTTRVNKAFGTHETYAKIKTDTLLAYLQAAGMYNGGYFDTPGVEDSVPFERGMIGKVQGNHLTFSKDQLRSSALFGAEIRRHVALSGTDINQFKDVKRIADTYGKPGGDGVTDEQLGAYFLGHMLKQGTELVADGSVSSRRYAYMNGFDPSELAFEYGRQIFAQNYPDHALKQRSTHDVRRLQDAAYQFETVVQGRTIDLFNRDVADEAAKAPPQNVSLSNPVLPEVVRNGALAAAERIAAHLSDQPFSPDRLNDLTRVGQIDGQAGVSQEELASYLAAMGIVDKKHHHPGTDTVAVSDKIVGNSAPEVIAMAQAVFNANFKKGGMEK